MDKRGLPVAGWGLATLSVTLLLLLVFGLYRETLGYLITKWNGEYAHGYLVLLISLYLIFSKRKTLASLQPCPSAPALLVVAIASLSGLFATVADVQMAQAASLLMLMLTITWAVLGSQVMRHLVFPILFLAFAIPVWSLLSPGLQGLTSDVAFWLTRSVGVPALREGHLIVLPAGQFSIEKACSGLRYLLAALTLGVLYGYLNYRGLRARILVLVIAAGAAILANVLRVFLVIYLGHVTEMQHPWVKDHLYPGWYLFGGVVFLLLLVDILVHRRGAISAYSDKQAENSQVTGKPCQRHTPYRAAVLTVTVVLVAAGPAFSVWLEKQVAAGPGGRLVFPATVNDWDDYGGIADDWEPFYPGAVTGKHEYRNNGNAVFMYVAYYPVQSQGKELINDLNRIAGKSIWKASNAKVRIAELSGIPVLEQRLKTDSGRQRLVWLWYEVAGWRTTNRYAAKLFKVAGAIMGRSRAAVIAVATDVSGDAENARQRIDSFISNAAFPVFQVVTSGG